MLNRFEARIAGLENPSKPDIYQADILCRPNDDFVVTRRRDGTVASRYSDLIWDISSWHSESRRNLLNFKFWDEKEVTSARDALIREARWLIFALVWISDGTPLKPSTVQHYMTAVRALARWADGASCSIAVSLSDNDFFQEFSRTSCTSTVAKILSGIIFRLGRLPEAVLGFRLIGSTGIRQLNRYSGEYGTTLQHPPIPTRIYSTVLSTLSAELADWEEVAEECVSLLRKCGQDPLYGRRKECQRIKANRLDVGGRVKPYWDDVVSPKLRAYLRRKGHSDNVMGLGRAVTEVQAVATLTIQAYSGMRRDECGSLTYNCREEVVSSGRVHRLILGRTTKMVSGVKRTRWVTNQEGHRAIAVACQIAEAIYDGCGESNRDKKNWKKRNVNYPLFVSIAYLKLGSKTRQLPSDQIFFARRPTLDNLDELRARLQPTIEDSDLIELEQIDAHRAWRSEEKFREGSPWVFSSHQLRRSLALYAQSSGLVTLPSLRRQLQHITDEMAYYYSRGSVYAKDIFGEDEPEREHFCADWQAAQIESEAVSYVVHVLTSDETLFGGHAAFVKRRLARVGGLITVSTREETIKMFKKGQLRYRETLIGGCTRVGECESPAVDWLSMECVTKNCSNMVGNKRKLEKVIVEQEHLVQSLPKSSLLFRTEGVILAKLRDALVNVKATEQSYE